MKKRLEFVLEHTNSCIEFLFKFKISMFVTLSVLVVLISFRDLELFEELSDVFLDVLKSHFPGASDEFVKVSQETRDLSFEFILGISGGSSHIVDCFHHGVKFDIVFIDKWKNNIIYCFL